MNQPKNSILGSALLVAGLVALLLLTPGVVSVVGPAPLRVAFGWGAYVVVVALVLGGLAIAFADRLGRQVRWDAVLYGECLFLAALAFTALATGADGQDAWRGRGGGIVGWALAQLLAALLGELLALAATVAAAGCAVWLLWRSLSAGRFFIPTPRLPVMRIPLLLASVLLSAAGRVWDLLRGLARDLWPGPAADGDAGGWAGAGRRDQPAGGLGPEDTSRRPVGQRGPASAREADAKSGGRSRSPAPGRRPPPPAGRAAEPRPAKTAQQGAPARAAPRDAARKPRPSSLPPLELLKPDEGTVGGNADVRERAQLLKQTLAEFGVPVEVVSIKEGPRVTQFGLVPGEIVKELRNGEVLRRRVSVHSIQRLSNDLALALAAASIRIEAPVPGRPYVGVEIPNTVKTFVSLRSILESREFARTRTPLAVALGRDVAGDPVVTDLTRLPHLLIAGATGAGKSVCINAIVCSLLMNNSSETVRFLMVDPKMVELPGYNGIPHLLGPVITDVSQTPGALAWLMLQMDDRYRLFADSGVRNIAEYNRKAGRSKTQTPLPYLVLVIDELADLMMTAVYDVERQLCRLAQMSRATGIHLVLATQRPSVDVITGLIKANFPARIAFAVTTQIDSRVILDTPGAEKLLGRGDMLFMAPDSAKLSRIQGCFVSDREIEEIVGFWKAHREEDDPAEAAVPPWTGMVDQMADKDDLLEKALQFLQSKQTVSTSLLQRQLRIGFPRAARLMEQLEEMGAVGPDEGGGRSRQVLAG